MSEEKKTEKTGKAEKAEKTEERNMKPAAPERSEVKLPFIEVAKEQNISRPLREALKRAFGWKDSTPLTVNKLQKATQKWLATRPRDLLNKESKK